MMTIDEIENDARDQERGHWRDLRDPVTGEKTGIRLRVVGPDSATQRRARLAFADELVELSDGAGRVSAGDREKARLHMLAACILDWEAVADELAVPFSTKAALRLLRTPWVHEQVDAMAADRAAFRGAV